MRRILLLLLFCHVLCSVAAQSVHAYPMAAADRGRMERAIQEYNKKHYRKSNDQLLQLSKLYPNNPDIYFYLGLNAVKRDFNATGIRRNFTQVIQLAPDYPDAVAHYYMGIIHYTDNQFDQAVDQFNQYFTLANSHGTPESDALYMEASNYLYWSQFLAEAYRHIAPYNPHVVAGVSSPEDELLPFFTHDGSQCFFLRYTSMPSPVAIHSNELQPKQLKLFSAARRDGLFANARILPAPFNQGDPEGSVSITADNRELFYSVIRRFRGYNNSDIYLSRFDGTRWSPVSNLGDSVNAADCWDSQPSVTPDGNTLYFASNRKGGLGGTDIWRCRRKADGTWSRPVNLGSSVNTPGNEKCPFIHADGHTLYFASDSWQGFGGYDIYYIDLDRDTLSRPTNLGLPFNTEEDDITFGVFADGTRAYYAGRTDSADRIGGTDVLTFDLYPAARPEAMTLIRGQVSAPDGAPLQATVTVTHGSHTSMVYTADPSGAFAILISQQRPNSVTVTAPGHHSVTLSDTRLRQAPLTVTLPRL